MNHPTRCKGAIALSCASGALLLVSGANAQTSSPVANAAVSSDESLQEVVVTAQKRTERLLDVPMSVTAATGDDLAERGITRAEDLGKLVPGFVFAQSENGLPIFFLRGIGFFTTALGVSPAVTVYTDQVPLPYTPMSRGATLDLDRIEVLKGPQGTLFGQNSTGGAINYIPAKPTDQFEAGFEFTAGRFGEADAEGYISGPIADGLTARLAIRDENMGDWQYNYADSQKLGQKHFLNGRLLVDWQASDRAKFEFSVSAWQDTSDAQQGQLIAYTPLFPVSDGGRPPLYPIASFPAAPNNDRATAFAPDEDLQLDNKFYQIALRGDFNPSDAVNLTSITSYVHYDEFNPLDLGFSIYPMSYQTASGTITSFSQELRLDGTAGPLRWLAGGNYQRDSVEELWAFAGSTSGQHVGPYDYDAFQVAGDQQIKTYSGFGSLDYSISDQLTLQGSSRYTQQDRDWQGCSRDNGDGTTAAAFSFLSSNISGSPQTIPPGSCLTLTQAGLPAGLLRSSLDQDNVSWRGSLNYKPDPDSLLYAGVTKGYKSGAYPSLPLIFASQVQPVPQESVLAYEAGAKADLLQRTVAVNGAVFYYDYRDKQLEGYRNILPFGALPDLVSIPKSRVWGAELGLVLRPIKGLTLSVNGTYVNSKVLSNPTDPTGPYPLYNTGPVTFVGDRFPFAPQWQSVMDGQYRFAVNGHTDAYFGMSITSRSATNGALLTNQASAAPYERLLNIPDYSLLDFRAGADFDDGRWGLQLWGRNVTDKFYLTSTGRANDSTFRFTGMPATFGITLKYRFRN